MTTARILSALLLATALTSGATETTGKATDTILPQEIVEAALNGRLDIVEKALDQGYKNESLDPQGLTALHFAAFNNQASIIRKLIDSGADVNQQDNNGSTPLMLAASAPGTETVQLLLEHGAKINTTDKREHWTALMWAAAEGQIENVKLLLKHNADATLKDVDGDTAESFAAQKGHLAIVKILKEAAPEKEAIPAKTETEKE